MVLEGVKHYYRVSVVGLCRRKETSFSVRCRVRLNALQRQQKPSPLVTVLGRGICSRCEALAPQPKDIPSAFRARAVVTGPWPAVWTVGCHLWRAALGAWVQVRRIEEQRLRSLEQALGAERLYL